MIMLDRSHIEQMLKLNGVEASAPEEEIKSVLISARWHENDVETALLVLRENKESHKTHVDSLHKVFRSDENLKPETISALLGIDVDILPDEVTSSIHRKRRASASQMMQIGLVSLSVSVIFVVASMWYLEMGFFHATLR